MSIIWGLCACVRVCVLSHFWHVWLFVTLWTIARQAPLSMGFSRWEYWSGFPCPSSGDLPNPGIEPTSLMSLVLADGFFTTGAIWEAWTLHILSSNAFPFSFLTVSDSHPLLKPSSVMLFVIKHVFITQISWIPQIIYYLYIMHPFCSLR